MAQTERDLADCVGAIYEAATGGVPWHEVGDRLRRLMNARRATLRLTDGKDPPPNLLMAVDEHEAVYAAYYHTIDPYVRRAHRDFAEDRTGNITRAKIGAELVDEDSFLHSEFYVDFARRHARRHMLGGIVGLERISPVALFRDESGQPFDAPDVRRMEILLPHLQRALELRALLDRRTEDSWLTRVALDALSVGIAIVDAGLKLHFLNDAGRRHLDDRAGGLCAMHSGPHAGSGVYLAARSRPDAAVLRRLVASATAGGPGGGMKVVGREGNEASALLISPAPGGVAGDHAGHVGGGLAQGLAMVVLQRLGRVPAPSVDMLCDLYGFSRAEAEVAAALSGGASAEDVARLRSVSLTTVRSQIRSILGKSECENLRDLESVMASLSALAPRRADADRR
jgi:hypothetical protein